MNLFAKLQFLMWTAEHSSSIQVDNQIIRQPKSDFFYKKYKPIGQYYRSMYPISAFQSSL